MCVSSLDPHQSKNLEEVEFGSGQSHVVTVVHVGSP